MDMDTLILLLSIMSHPLKDAYDVCLADSKFAELTVKNHPNYKNITEDGQDYLICHYVFYATYMIYTLLKLNTMTNSFDQQAGLGQEWVIQRLAIFEGTVLSESQRDKYGIARKSIVYYLRKILRYIIVKKRGEIESSILDLLI